MSESKPGQPTNFESQFCQWLVDHMAQGYSFETFRAELHKRGVSRSRASLFNWKNPEHDSFQAEWLEAYELGKDLGQFFWEKQGIEGLFSSSEEGTDDQGKRVFRSRSAVSTGVWALNMRNRYGWRDKIEISTPNDGKPQRLIIKMDDGEET